MFVKPVPGRLLRDPVSKRAVPAGGREVPSSPYWLAALRDGDVVPADAKPEPAAETPAPDAAPEVPHDGH